MLGKNTYFIINYCEPTLVEKRKTKNGIYVIYKKKNSKWHSYY